MNLKALHRSKPFKIQYGEIYRVKTIRKGTTVTYLKSSMERFIAVSCRYCESAESDLKSSMERFIEYLHARCKHLPFI